MTAQEIKDLIASKIAGQGSAVDAGSALPEILNGIVDAIGGITSTFVFDLKELGVWATNYQILTGEQMKRLLNAPILKGDDGVYSRIDGMLTISLTDQGETQIYSLLNNSLQDIPDVNVHALWGEYSVLPNIGKCNYLYAFALVSNDENVYLVSFGYEE